CQSTSQSRSPIRLSNRNEDPLRPNPPPGSPSGFQRRFRRRFPRTTTQLTLGRLFFRRFVLAACRSELLRLRVAGILLLLAAMKVNDAAGAPFRLVAQRS